MHLPLPSLDQDPAESIIVDIPAFRTDIPTNAQGIDTDVVVEN